MTRFRLLAAASVLGAMVTLLSIASFAHDAPAKPQQPARRDDAGIRLSEHQIAAGNFAVHDVGGGLLSKRIIVPGTIVPSGDRIAKVSVRLLGTVAELRKRLGDDVREGDVLAIIESREVADAKSEYLAARLVFDLQQTLFNRSKSLWDGKVMSENDFLRARTTFEDARVKLELARQKLFALGLNAEQVEALPQQPVESLRRQDLRAPISGRIADRRVELGSLVGREGQESELFTIVDLAVVWAELAVSPSDLAGVREGQAVQLSSGNVSSPATISFISPLLDKDTRSARVIATVDNAARIWRPGAFVSAEIPVDQAKADIVVPRSALQVIERADVVFVRTPDGFEARRVKLGRQDHSVAEVTSGLKPGERVATANSFVLKAELGKATAEHEH